MPTSGNRGNVARRSAYRLRGKSARSMDISDVGPAGDCGDLLQIGPALGGVRSQARAVLGPRAHSTQGRREPNATLTQEHRIEKERCDRISLDRRGLTSLPSSLCSIDPPFGPRLLSLQHNLLASLTGLSSPGLQSLVLLDLYDNQLQDIQYLDQLKNLRVLLIGKNRIRKIDGLSGVGAKLEVLDLHGNRICQACGLSGLRELKVLNLAGNQLRSVDLTGLPQLRELNLKRNKLQKLMGCDGAPKLQKLFLSNNDLQSIEDISSVATVSSLREITLDGNPVALGGDCIPFLVSHLPTLGFLSQMQVTEQVRRAAMAWRQNKEASDNSVYGDVADEADARREQVISNARTNWELLRSQNKCLNSPTASFTNNNNTTDYIIETNNTSLPKSETPDLIKTTTAVQFVKPQTTMIYQTPKTTNSNKYLPINGGLIEKRVNFSNRTMSQDTDTSHSTSTSSELLKLPPILVPIIDSLEHQRLTLTSADPTNKQEPRVLKRWESISSVDPVVNSSLSSLPTTTSESESEVAKKPVQRRVQTAQKKRASFAASKSVSISEPSTQNKLNFKNRSVSDNSENISVVSSGTNLNSVLTNSSTSGSDLSSKKVLVRANSAKSRYTKSATTSRKAMKIAQNRPVTAKAKSSKIVEHVETPKKEQPSEPVVKEREQGGDWLVEVRGEEASVWGAGALRRLEKGWPQALNVTTIHFHYINFGAICAVLPTIKNRFPNAVHLNFRACGLSVCGQLGALAALRGLHSLSIHREGNPITSRSNWQQFALYRLAHWGLRTIDDKEMTDDDISTANDVYSGLSDVVLWSLPDSLLQPLLVRLQGEKEGNKYNIIGDKDGIGTVNSNQGTERDNSNTRRRPLEREGSVQRRPLEREGSIQRRPLEREGSFQQRGRVLERENSIQQRKEVNNPVFVVKKATEKEGNDETGVSSISEGTARAWLWNADPALRDVVAREALQWRRSVLSQEEVLFRHRGHAHLSRLLLQAVDASIKLRMLRRHWPALLVLFLTKILQDFTNMDQHVAEHMKQLNLQIFEEGMSKK